MDNSLALSALDICKDFSELTPQEKKKILPYSRIVELKQGEDVFALKHQEKYFFIVLFGQQSLCLRSKTGHFKAGDLFGEITLFSEVGRLGTIHCKENSTLLAIDKDCILKPNLLPSELRVKMLLILGKKMAGYFYKNAPIPISEQIKQEESLDLEFKESYSSKKEAKKKIFETLVAFMNTRGGALIFGVNDSKKLIGVRMEKSFDQFRLDISSALKGLTGKSVGEYIEIQIEEIRKKVVIRILVRPSSSPVVFNNVNQHQGLFIRQDGQNSCLTNPVEIINYANKRFSLHNISR